MDETLADLEVGAGSVAELLERLGGISPYRVRMTPAPGTATVRDVVRLREKTRRVYELVDGTLVEKVMGLPESTVAMRLSNQLNRWNDANGEPGYLTGADGTIKLMNKLVRAPDLAFTYFRRAPNGRVPNVPVPDLAVEVPSDGNTREEMERKLKEYFLSEVRLVWYIDPRTRTVKVYTSPDNATELAESDALDGGDLLPGFSMIVGRLFNHLGPAAKPVKPASTDAGKKPKKRK